MWAWARRSRCGGCGDVAESKGGLLLRLRPSRPGPLGGAVVEPQRSSCVSCQAAREARSAKAAAVSAAYAALSALQVTICLAPLARELKGASDGLISDPALQRLVAWHAGVMGYAAMKVGTLAWKTSQKCCIVEEMEEQMPGPCSHVGPPRPVMRREMRSWSTGYPTGCPVAANTAIDLSAHVI